MTMKSIHKSSFIIGVSVFTTFLSFIGNVNAHAAPFNPSFWGFNVTAQTFDYDNRMVAPLANMPFNKWWFHNHLAYPPHPTDITSLPAGGSQTFEIACDKGATSFFASSPGGNIQNGNNPCPELPTTAFHAHNASDAAGCAWGIAYKNNVNDVEPEDFTIFSTNRVCVWNRFNEVEIPEKMPPCPGGMCICAFFWIHNADAGSAQMFMNGFQCNITNSTSTVPVSKGKLPRLCGADIRYGTTEPHPDNCTYGSKTPFYWLQTERSNIFQDVLQPPVYNTLYNFVDGAQDDIFEDSLLPVYVDVNGSNVVASYTVQGSGAVATGTVTGGASAQAIPVSISISYSASTSASATVTSNVGVSTSTSTSTSNGDGNSGTNVNVQNEQSASDDLSASVPVATATRTISLVPVQSGGGGAGSGSDSSSSDSDSDSSNTSSSSDDSSNSLFANPDTNTNTDSTTGTSGSSDSSNSNSSSNSKSNSNSKTCKRRKSKRSSESASGGASFHVDVGVDGGSGSGSESESESESDLGYKGKAKHRRTKTTNPFVRFGEGGKF